MKRIFLAIFALFYSLCAVSSVDDGNDPCNGTSGASTQECLAPAWAASEKEMKAVYDLAEEHLKKYSPGLVKDFISAQKIWIQFREQYCTVFGNARVSGNTWTNYWISECKAKLAKDRQKGLLEIYDY